MLSVRVLVFGPDAQADPANKNIATITAEPNRYIPISSSRDFPRPINRHRLSRRGAFPLNSL
jgi:hypothetical protein